MTTKPLNMGDAPRVTEILARYFHPDQPFNMAEVGVYRGQTSAAILRAFSGCHLWMVDSWEAADPNGGYAKSGDGVAKLTEEEQSENYLAAVRAVQFAACRIGVFRQSSLSVAEVGARIRSRLDAVLLDAAHDYDSVVADIAAWRPLLRSGSPFIFHDYGHPRNNGRGYGVRQAVDEWAAREGRKLEMLGSMAWAEV